MDHPFHLMGQGFSPAIKGFATLYLIWVIIRFSELILAGAHYVEQLNARIAVADRELREIGLSDADRARLARREHAKDCITGVLVVLAFLLIFTGGIR